MFIFVICPRDVNLNYCGNNKYFCTLMAGDNGRVDRTNVLSHCRTNPRVCARLLHLDNWEFKKDYPYKL